MRSKVFNSGIILCSTFLLTSCSILFPTKLTRRYKSSVQHNYATNDSIKYLVGVNGYAFELEKEKEKPEPVKNIFSLSPDGQKQLIETIGDNEKTSPEVFNMLAQNIGDEKTPDRVIDNTRFTKRLVFSVANLSVGQADRILKLSVSLSLKGDDNLKVISCDKIVTNYQTVDLGKLNFSNTNNLSLSGNAGVSSKMTGSKTRTTDAANNNGTGLTDVSGTEVNAGYGATGTAANTRTFAEEVMLRQRYVSLSSYVNAKGVNFYEESVSGVDLTGNIIADVTFEYPANNAGKVVYSFSGLQNKDKTFAKPNDIITTQQKIFYPNVKGDISLSYTYEATVRKVVKGDNTISEADDEIQVVKGSAAGNEITIAAKDQLVPKIWMISDGNSTIEISGPAEKGTLMFGSYERALDFILWFKKASSDILANNRISNGDYQIVLSGGATLTDSFIKNCTVKLF